MNKPILPMLTSERFNICSYFDAVCDYSMPQYYPEVRKIISASATVLPDTKFLSGNSLEFGGTVAYNVLYIGEDSSLSSLVCTSDYSEKVTLPEEIRAVDDTDIDISVSDCTIRVTAPRKISLKAKLTAQVRSDKEVPVSYTVTVGEKPADMGICSTVKTLAKKIPTMSRRSAFQSCSATGEFNVAPGTKILSCPAVIDVREATPKSSAVMVRGDISVKCLCFTDRGIYAPHKFKIPFEEAVPFDGLGDGDTVCALGRVASLTLSEEGEASGNFKAEAEFDLTCRSCRKYEVTVIEDAYSTAYDIAETRCNITPLSPIAAINTSLSVSGVGKRKTRPEKNEYLIDIDLFPEITKAEVIDDKAVFTGKCTAKAYIASDGDVICEEFSLPIRFECPSVTRGEGEIICTAFCNATDSSARLEGDTIAVNGEVSMCLEACRKSNISAVVQLEADPTSKSRCDMPSIKVIYPEESERVWDIAKSRGADIDSIERVNNTNRCEFTSEAIIIPIK